MVSWYITENGWKWKYILAQEKVIMVGGNKEKKQTYKQTFQHCGGYSALLKGTSAYVLAHQQTLHLLTQAPPTELLLPSYCSLVEFRNTPCISWGDSVCFQLILFITAIGSAQSDWQTAGWLKSDWIFQPAFSSQACTWTVETTVKSGIPFTVYK